MSDVEKKLKNLKEKTEAEIQENVGKVTDNEELELKGKLKNKAIDAKEKVKDAKDDALEKINDILEESEESEESKE